MDVVSLGKRAKEAERILAKASSENKNRALISMSEIMLENERFILAENSKDIENAKKSNLPDSMIERLTLSHDRIVDMAKAISKLAFFDDPVGKVLSESTHTNGMIIEKVSVPLGVIAIIFESRPNVASDAAALCLKSGNAVILKGGKEACFSNFAIVKLLRDALKKTNIPIDAIQIVEDNSRSVTEKLMKLNEYVDVLIPRGGAGLISNVVENSTVPVIETGVGNCHVYVDEFADIEMAKNIILNAKTQRVSVCNTCESMIFHKKIAKNALPVICKALIEKNVEIRGDEESRKIFDRMKLATDQDFATEFLNYIISCKIVENIDEAIDHIFKYGTKHSETIVTENDENAQRFLKEIDAAAVYVNASTRFTDGGEFGLGAEIGISTQKLHARGPMGLSDLQSFKYKIYGKGQVRS